MHLEIWTLKLQKRLFNKRKKEEWKF
ncbi:hypothetical protein CGLO_14091 [Colletotrichum gloeosporioides Cg-14]|uniref:Uncharacterized protein n=1 Tax=Colletotrichum gloeosporioides (strain Cg-14) TaxID=1237896 RepID=T0LEM2_COLGC|nr:hypothetical protein CGLO_14091 [Colletotrichum gloeosporioides Cg-14]